MSGQSGGSAQAEWQMPNDGSTFYDPLLGCLVVLTRHQGQPHSADSLRAGLPLVNDRLTPELFVRAAQRAGLSARVSRRSLKKISPLVLPAVLLLKNGQACVLLELGKKAKTARVIFPESGQGEQTIDGRELAREYTGYVIFTKPEHRFDERTPEVLNVRSRHWFWGTIARSWRIYRDVLIASLLVNLFALASPLFVMNVYDRVVPNNATETLWVLASGVMLVYLFDFLMRSLRGYFIDLAGKKSDVMLSAAIFEQVLGLKMAARPESVGAFANNLREFESIRDFITSASITALVDLPFVFLFLGVIWMIGGPIVLVPVLAIPIIVLFGLIMMVPLRHAVEKTFRASAQKNATLIESLTGVETIKTMNAESPVQHRWEQAVGYIARFGVRSRLLSSSVVNFATFMQQIASVAVVAYGVYLIGDGSLSMGGLIASVILTGRALSPMGQVANLATRYHQASAALKTLNGVMGMPVERPEGQSFVNRPAFKGGIEFQNVSFAYPGQANKALDRVSLRIRAGEKVGVIGRIGSGKTTIEKLMLGLYEPDDGAVRIDGVDIRQIDPADLRRNVGYVSQDVMLFYGSVRENIVYGAPYADDAMVLKAADLAGVTEFVNRSPLGFDMPVGERGEALSGGQRQSVVIARSLLLDPPVLVFDEPSNSMDNSTEARFKTRLAETITDKTVVLVTHRASLLDLVDRLIVMEDGRVVADGPKDQVMEALRQGKLRTGGQNNV